MALCVMSIETDASGIESLIEAAQLSKALWLLRDALARSPRDQSLLTLAAKLAAAAESKAMDLACNKATDGSRQAQEMEAIARQAREYLTC
jgi:hypothetical protein